VSTPASAARGGAIARVLTAILRHPVAMRVKAMGRDLAWRGRSRALRNPPLAPAPGVALFLCKGNICRSPFAGLLAAQLFAEAGLSTRSRSAGLKASQAPVPPADAMQTATRYGLSLESHRPVDVTADELRQADLIVVMEVEQAAEVVRRAPDVAARVQILPLYDPEADRYGAYERVNLVDPFQKGPAAFTDAYARIDRSLRALVAQLAAAERAMARRA
jgi:protein-tyrosine phosphatase